MTEHDFLVCTFEGDTTVYVAEILNVFTDSFACRFVHTESHYTFSADTWTVLESTGAFPEGTPLTSHDLYTRSGGDLILNSFVSVTFANGKSYLGRIITMEPQVVRFLHKGIPVYVFENGIIINSGGIYPKGQSINNIEAYELAGGNNDVNNTAQVDLSQKGISYNGQNFLTIAPEIQGNILKSHGRDHTTHILFKFNAGKVEDAKAFIRDFADTKVTSALAQKQDSDKIIAEKKLAKQEGREPQLEQFQTLFISFLLSFKGYEFLEIDTSGLGFDSDFSAGMKAANTSNSQLFDNPVSNWEPEYQNEIHGMILVAWGGANRTELDTETDKIITLLVENGLATIVKVEKGDGIKNANGDHIEHFGYVDGISQPKFFTEELSELKDDGVETNNWDPLMPLDLVLIKDNGGTTSNSFGSYMVFRKLEQNVKGFSQEVVRLAGELFGSSTSDQADLTGAMVVGRFKNGMPVTLTSQAQKIEDKVIDKALIGKMNDFNYSNDADGAKCPFHAHIRKTNPRGGGSSSETSDAEKRHMMARRGISYGGPSDETAQAGKGLLFMSFQASIFKQFEYQQEVFANADDTGKDPLVGQGEFADGKQMYAKNYDNKNSIAGAKSFGGFVTLKGGEYFFAPSFSFLKSLSPSASSDDSTDTTTNDTSPDADNATSTDSSNTETDGADSSGSSDNTGVSDTTGSNAGSSDTAENSESPSDEDAGASENTGRSPNN